jgi:Tfp pilus tip-associated adhesin PilY1
MDSVAIAPNTEDTPIAIADLGGQVFHVVLNNADVVTYPISVNYSWVGVFTGSASDPIASGLTSAPGVAFNVTAGESYLEVFVGSGLNFAKKTFYFKAS